MAHENAVNWPTILPIVLLGIRATTKPDLGCCPAELVYGTTLLLPADFFVPSQASVTDPPTYVDKLRQIFEDVRPASPRTCPGRTPFEPQALSTATHVFVRRDAVRKALQPPYSGPHLVISRSSKHFTLNVNGKSDTVSIDRLKPAFVEPPVSPTCSAVPFSASPPLAIPAHPLPRKKVSWSDRSFRSLGGGPCSRHRFAAGRQR
ncbi:uncharacterized protein LOC135398695 [Ornithodoros turicata]|uniref:uncharacterized protein LOC135398695 n=1 Tax=Ornithodoros turicata TaxID=34597 RepID=UPI003139028D